MFELRGYQREMLLRLEAAWAEHRSVLVQMPTGTGKTVLMAEAIRREKRKAISDNSGDGKVLVVAHRRELIEQIRRTFGAFGLGDDVVVESIQKLSRGGAHGDRNPVIRDAEAVATHRCSSPHVRLVIIDEAHHALARTYRELWERWPGARFLGLTATPCRLSGEAFTDLFEVLLQSWSIQQFIDRGWLSDFEYVSAAPDSAELRRLGLLDKRGADGDYQMKQMATVMDVPESIGHLYETYREYVNGKKGVVYAIDRGHARHIAAYYREKGVRCAVIDSRTPAKEREGLVEAYRKGAIDVLVNVDIFGEGFDVPEVEFIQLARPTLSLSKYLQQVGRGMRVSEGKEAVTILDNVGMYMTFGLPTDERDWRLMFLGKVAGKGCLTGDYRLVVSEEEREPRVLVNLKMVRIKRRNERHEGVEVFMQGGKYGVMKNGKVTCLPVFQSIRRCGNGLFYALATYPYAMYRNRTTVIDKEGADLMVQMYGKIEQKGDFLYGSDITGKPVVWDAIGKRQYKGRAPNFEHLGGLDILPCGKWLYELRYTKGMQSFHFGKEEVMYNNYIAIIRDKLIVKNDGYKIYRIFGYQGDHVLICTRKPHESIQVSWDGRIGQLNDRVPDDISFSPNCRRLRLTRAV